MVNAISEQHLQVLVNHYATQQLEDYREDRSEGETIRLEEPDLEDDEGMIMGDSYDESDF